MSRLGEVFSLRVWAGAPEEFAASPMLVVRGKIWHYPQGAKRSVSNFAGAVVPGSGTSNDAVRLVGEELWQS